MCFFTKLLFISFCALFLFITADAQSAESYTITVDEKQPKVLHIEAELALQDDILYMHEDGAEQFPRRWAHFVRNFAVKDSGGNAVSFEELPDAKWKIKSPVKSKITISYDVLIDHEAHSWPGGIDGVAFSRESGIFATGRTFLVMNGKDARNIPVSFNIPASWRATTPWKPKTKNTFIARDLTDFRESMVQIGAHDEFSVTRNGFELVFALSGKGVASQRAAYEKLANGVLDYYIRVMGGIPKPPPSRPFKRVVVIVNSGKDVDGEVIGNHISMILDPEADAFSQVISKFIFAHEFFHLWNGKSINVASTKEDWFKEGITNYYTLKALLQTGAITEKDYLDTLSNLFYKRYVADTGYALESMRDVAAGASKDKHWGLIYSGGLFAGMCQDIGIRRASGNRKSLDDLMRSFFKKYGGSDKVYTTTDVQSYLTALSGADQSDFFGRHIFGIQPVQIEKCLSEAGFDSKIIGGELLISRRQGLSSVEEAILKRFLGQ
jgi:predicted metalloprotease with PDZ domain